MKPAAELGFQAGGERGDEFFRSAALDGAQDARLVVEMLDAAEADIFAERKLVLVEVLKDHADAAAKLRSVPIPQIATVELFEFMIGNTDWSILKGHNIVHLRAADKSVVAVPYDFDSSGIVDASYATPPPNLRIRSVTQRVYRGFCHPGLGWETLFQLFEAKREPIEALVEQVPSLNEGERSEARAYVASFYEILGSAERRQKNIVDKCRPVADRS